MVMMKMMREIAIGQSRRRRSENRAGSGRAAAAATGAATTATAAAAAFIGGNFHDAAAIRWRRRAGRRQAADTVHGTVEGIIVNIVINATTVHTGDVAVIVDAVALVVVDGVVEEIEVGMMRMMWVSVVGGGRVDGGSVLSLLPVEGS